MLHQLQVHRQILYDLAAHYLDPMSGSFERLFYLASLRSLTSGIYAHDHLSRVYGEQPVSEALAKAHEEIFEGLLELPLAQQEQDLRAFLGSRTVGDQRTLEDFEEGIPDWMPPDSPVYLKSLFRSNVGALRELLAPLPSKARSDT